jgi:hypothetical protein
MIFAVSLSSIRAASSTYTITYINGSNSYTKTYDAGNTVTLDPLPSGAIAWTDDNNPLAPNNKMAYVNYTHADTVNGVSTTISVPMTLTINNNITLTANYGSYGNGQQGPRLIQFHLELKFFDMTNNVFMGFEQHYNNINAPSGYYVALPSPTYFGDGLYAQISGSGGLVNTGQVVASWVSDGSYTGTTNEPATNIFAPNTLVYVDPNNYNMIYDAMVNTTYNPNFAQTLPPDAPANPDSPDTVPTDTDDSITFRISQANIPPANVRTDLEGNSSYPVYGGTFAALWDTNHPPNWQLSSSPDVYLNWFSGQAQLTLSGLQPTQPWGAALPRVTMPPGLGGGTYTVLPVAVNVVGYTFYWDIDGTPIPLGSGGLTNDNSLNQYMTTNGITPDTAIGGSHVFTLHYVPNPVTIQLYVDGHTSSVVYDGTVRSVAGYDVYDCSAATSIDQDNLLGSGCTLEGTSIDGSPLTLTNGDVLNFANTGGNSNIIATGTNVGTYPLVLIASDFSVTNTSGALYNLTMSNGGLTITKKPIVIIVDPPIDPNTPGTGNTSVVTPQDPGDLVPGQTIVTPNGDGTITANTGDGDVIYIDRDTDNPLPYDPSKPNGGLIVIIDPGNIDPGTGKPTDATNNYDVNHVLPKPKPSNDNNNGNNGNGGGSGAVSNTFPVGVGLPKVPGVPNTGYEKNLRLY